MDASSFELVQVPSKGSPDHEAVYDQCIQLRITVFVDEQKFPLETEIEPADDTATHILLRLAAPPHTPVGTVRIHQPDAAYYKLARIVVLKEYRKYGLGAVLVRGAHDWAVEDHRVRLGRTDPVKVVTHSQIPVKPFYARMGYVPEGDEFDEEGAPHQKMVIHIPLQG